MKNNLEPWKTMRNQPGTMKNHENRPGTMNNQPGTMNTHENRPGNRSTSWFETVGQSAHFSWQTDKQNLPIIYRYHHRHYQHSNWGVTFKLRIKRYKPTNRQTYLLRKCSFFMTYKHCIIIHTSSDVIRKFCDLKLESFLNRFLIVRMSLASKPNALDL